MVVNFAAQVYAAVIRPKGNEASQHRKSPSSKSSFTHAGCTYAGNHVAFTSSRRWRSSGESGRAGPAGNSIAARVATPRSTLAGSRTGRCPNCGRWSVGPGHRMRIRQNDTDCPGEPRGCGCAPDLQRSRLFHASLGPARCDESHPTAWRVGLARTTGRWTIDCAFSEEPPSWSNVALTEKIRLSVTPNQHIERRLGSSRHHSKRKAACKGRLSLCCARQERRGTHSEVTSLAHLATVLLTGGRLDRPSPAAQRRCWTVGVAGLQPEAVLWE